MAVKVRLTDTEITLGGDFWKAKEFIKGQGGKFDGTTKTWSLNQSLKEFSTAATFHGFPFDLPNGDHRTSYGTHYKSNEWAANKEVWNAESRIAKEFSGEYFDLYQELFNRLNAIIPHAASAIAGIIRSDNLLYAEEIGRIKFSTPEKKTELLAIEEWYWKATNEIGYREMDAEAIATAKILEKYDIE